MWNKGYGKALIIASAVTIALAVVFFAPPALPEPISGEYSEHRILLKYSAVECAGVIAAAEQGGAELYAAVGLSVPESGMFELEFADGWSAPFDGYDHFDRYIIAGDSRYTYNVYGRAVGMTAGRLDCGDPQKYIYNETVPKFEVARWAPTFYEPFAFFSLKSFIIIALLWLAVPINIVAAFLFLVANVR